MSTYEKTGGPAFPIVQDACPGVHSGGVESWGMTLRDYFAAKSLDWCLSDTPVGSDFYKRVAQGAYRIADAMMKARND